MTIKTKITTLFIVGWLLSLNVFSLFAYHRTLTYVAFFLLMQMPEEEAFCVFVKLMQDYRLRELFKPSMAELGLCMYQFECMIQVKVWC